METSHAISLSPLRERRRLGRDDRRPEAAGHGRVHRLHAGAAQGRRAGRLEPPAADRGRDDRARRRRQVAGARRPVCRHEGATRRLLPRRRARSRRGARLGRALSRRGPRHDRSTARLADAERVGRMTRSNGDGRARAAAEAVARTSYGKLVAFLAARTRDVAAAEDALSEAFAAALLDWPAKEIPSSPEAWLLAVARRWMIDAARRQRTVEHAGDDLRLISEEIEAVADSRSDIP